MTAPSAAIRSAVAGARALPLARPFTLAGLAYLLGGFVVTLWLWRDPASRTAAGNPEDADFMAWFFRYSATAVAHLHLPALVTTAMNAPQGINVMWNASVMWLGVALAPVTLLAGPQVSATVLITAGFAGSALAMFVVLRRWDVSAPAAALGGLVYGFSPAAVPSAIGHYDLQFIVLPPLIADAVMRLAAGRAGARRGGVQLGLLAAAQLLIDEEVLFLTAVTVAILLLVLGLRARLSGLGPAVRGLGIACATFLVVAGYPLWVQFFGPLREHGSAYALDFYENDLSGFITPSSLQVIHTTQSAAVAANHPGYLGEYLAYLGGPLLIVLLGSAVRWWRRPVIRALAVTWVVTEVFSLGGTLLVNGHEHAAVKLPWYWVQSLPLLQSVIPDRFSLIADGAAAALLAFAIDAAMPAVTSRRRQALVVMSVAVLAVLPILPRPLPVSSAAPLPPGWSAVFADLRLPPSATVLVVPVPTPYLTEPLRWQADTGEPATLIGGAFLGPDADGHAAVGGGGPPVSALYLNQLWMAEAPTEAVSAEQVQAQLIAWRVTAVVAVTTPGSVLARYLAVILGHPAASAGDVIAWWLPPALS